MLKKISLLIFLLFSVFCMSTAQHNTPPNIVIIFMDDMGYGDIESYGSIGYETPNFNRLSREGMRFTNFYAAQAVCSASRAALLTGCYPNRVGIANALFPWSRTALNPEEETIAELLKKEGYATGIVGKWHLGDDVPYLPLNQGFDEYLGLPYSNDMWPVGYDGKPVDTTSGKYRYPPLPLIEGNKAIRIIKDLNDQAELTALYTRKAVDFIRDHKDAPFFLYLAHSMPHVPLAASEKFAGESKAGLYGDVISELDWSVGQIMNTLDELELEENTFVIFTSDNGPWLTFGNHSGSTAGLREGKGTAWEGGVRVPCIMKWPGVIPQGAVNHQLISTIDILPTVAAITGAPLPERKIDGINMVALLKGGKTSPREYFYYYYGKNELRAVRKGHWKLVLPHISRTYHGYVLGKDGFPGDNHSDTVSLALYNLRIDPGEHYDRQEAYPEVVADLKKLAEQARADLGDRITGRAGANRREPAYVDR